jgi:UDP-3-O-[3-hydroxymyristoyl] glucosamine N-acyltransferase
MKLSELSSRLGGTVAGVADPDITGAEGIAEAGEGQITFATGPEALTDLERSRAAAALVPLDTPDLRMPLIRVQNPRLAFARVLELFYVRDYRATGVSDMAAIAKDALIGEECSIHPFAVLAEQVRIGNRVTVHSGTFVGEGSSIGDDSVIHANVSIGHRTIVGKRVIIHSGTVVGSDGFGFVTDSGVHHKIPQVGGVIIEDDVEIGGNCTIDRATLGNTRIGKGTKLDNQVHVAHNVTIGEHCLLAGQVGIAGSSTLGNYVVFGGQAGVADHTTIGDRVMAGGKAVITRDVEAGQVIAGYNAMPLRDWLKVQAILPKLPELKKLIMRLEKQVQELREKAE